MDNVLMMNCPLCYHKVTLFFFKDKRREYFQCKQCELVFVSPGQHLLAKDEKARYDLHQNNPEDQGYTNFLKRIATPIADKITPPAAGLDFGSGPVPALSQLLKAKGFDMSIYDPFYASDPSPLNQKYDFITCCEVAEHLSKPGAIFKQLAGLLKKDGWLAVMTDTLPDKKNFSAWSYKNDPTHVCFYTHKTFAHIAKLHNCILENPYTNVFLLMKR